MRRFTSALLALSAALALSACGKSAPPAAATAGPAQGRAVTVVRVENRPISGALSASGDLVARQEVAIVSEITGYSVAAVLADVGDHVRKGQVLARLDPSLIGSQIAQAEAQLAQAEAQAAQAEDQASRVEGLDDQGVLSSEQIAQRRFEVRSARAAARVQAEALRNLRTREAKLQVTAPVDGVVLEKKLRLGDLSSGGTTPWFLLASEGQIELQAQLSERDLSRVHSSQKASVTLPSGAVVEGVVRLVSPQIDTQTKLGYVRISLPVREDIRAGGFGNAVFNDASGLVLSVPETAVRYDADGASVMLVQADKSVKRMPVRTGMRGSGLVELVEGPPAGSQVVRSAASFLLDGDHVQPVEDVP